MNDERLQTIEPVKHFLEGSEALEFKRVSVEERYHWIETVLVRFRYYRLKRADKGVIRRYIEKVSGYSRAQETPPLGLHRTHWEIRPLLSLSMMVKEVQQPEVSMSPFSTELLYNQP